MSVCGSKTNRYKKGFGTRFGIGVRKNVTVPPDRCSTLPWSVIRLSRLRLCAWAIDSASRVYGADPQPGAVSKKRICETTARDWQRGEPYQKAGLETRELEASAAAFSPSCGAPRLAGSAATRVWRAERTSQISFL